MANVKARHHYIRIELQEVREHLEHRIDFDSGGASFHGEAEKYEYSLWCSTCLRSVGSSIVLKGEELEARGT